MAPYILASTVDHVRVLSLNRPDKLNAWTASMRSVLVEAIDEACVDERIRALVLTGEGSGFCAGQDLNETAEFAGDTEASVDWVRSFERLYAAILDSPKPVIAALNGVAAGSGFQFALVADMRVGHPGVRMGQPEILSGIPSITGIWAMWSILGRAKTTELAMTGELVNGEEACRLGLLNRVVAREDVRAEAILLAQRLGDLPPGAMRATKAWLRELEGESFAAAFREAERAHSESYASGEPQREMKRFIGGGSPETPSR